MSHYFKPDGAFNFKRLSQMTFLVGAMYTFGYVLGVAPVREMGLNSYVQPRKWFMSDCILFSKIKPDKKGMPTLIGHIVALDNPYAPGETIYRRVIATENLWIKRKDDGGIIKVPNGHVWIENVTPDVHDLAYPE